MKTVTYYVVTNKKLVISAIIASGVLIGILMDDAMVGGIGNYFGKLQCEKMMFADEQAKCNNLRNSSIEWLLIMPFVSGFLSFAMFARRLIWN